MFNNAKAMTNKILEGNISISDRDNHNQQTAELSSFMRKKAWDDGELIGFGHSVSPIEEEN